MNFDLTEEQQIIRDTLARYLATRCSFDSRRQAAWKATWQADVWNGLAHELGILGATLPEALGGSAGGAVETMLICEELGRHLAAVPYLETCVLGASLLQAGGGEAQTVLAGIADGSARPVAALYERHGRFNLAQVQTEAELGEDGHWRLSGEKSVVTAAPFASHLLASARTADGIALFLMDAGDVGITRRDYQLIDGSPASDIGLNHVRASLVCAPHDALSRIECAVDHTIAALCSEAVGLMQSTLDSTVDYAKQRTQFGQPIGKFQALQHRMVDMLTRVERARSMTIMAALSLDEPEHQRRYAVSAAKAYVAEAARYVAQAAIQIHGGIGTTDELAVSHYFKRLTVLELLFGSPGYHYSRMAEASEIAEGSAQRTRFEDQEVAHECTV